MEEMDAGSAAALYAGSVLIRKTFEAVAQRSVSSLFTRLHTHFRGQHQVPTTAHVYPWILCVFAVLY